MEHWGGQLNRSATKAPALSEETDEVKELWFQ
jgi:hypothetical protein